MAEWSLEFDDPEEEEDLLDELIAVSLDLEETDGETSDAMGTVRAFASDSTEVSARALSLHPLQYTVLCAEHCIAFVVILCRRKHAPGTRGSLTILRLFWRASSKALAV